MRIYAIDDEPKMLRLLHDAIAQAAPEAEILDFSGAAGAIEAAAQGDLRPDAVFSDIELPGMSGLALAVRIKNAAPQARIVFVTGYEHYALEAYRLHVHGYILKPVDPAAVRAELDELPAAPQPEADRLYARCFGPFEVFWDGQPLLFERRKTKELLAFLIDRNGAVSTAEEIAAVLWEDEGDLRKAKHQIRNLVGDLRATLRRIGREDLLIRRSGMLAVRPEGISCDYYRLLRGDGDAVNADRGEYMRQYSWAELTAGKLWFVNNS